MICRVSRTDENAPGTLTRAAGVRLPYAEVPERVQRWVDRELGSTVECATTQTGGFSPGTAARLVTRNGRRAFVKAVGSVLNPDTPGLLRRERTAMAALPPLPWTPTLLAAYDDGDWVGLLFDDIDGREPVHPWTPDDTDLVFGALSELTDALTPSPWPDAPRPSEETAFGRGWDALREDPPTDLDSWVRQHLDDLAELQQQARTLVTGESLLHWDIRADNVLVTRDGGVVFVDWAWARLGPGWLDTTLAALDLVVSGSGVDPDLLLARHPCTRQTDPADLTAVIVAVAGMLTDRSRAPAPAGLPTIRSYQRLAADSLTAWMRRRLG